MKLGRIAVVGRGKVGTALTRALRRALRGKKEAEVTLVRGRGLKKLVADTVILTVPDGSLAHACLALAEKGGLVGRKLKRKPVILHVSGLRDASALSVLHEAGFPVGAMHPLVSFANVEKHPPLAKSTLVISGDRAAIPAARRIARVLGMRPLVRPLQGATYHAAAALLANGTVALAAEASRMLGSLGVGKRARELALAGLLRSVAHHVENLGVPAALTGPIARGDASAVALHLSALGPRERAAYAGIARLIVPVAIDAGLAPAQATMIVRAIDEGERPPPRRAPRA